MVAKQIYRLQSGAWKATGGRILYPPGFTTPTGRVSRVRSASVFTASGTNPGDYRPDATNTGVPAGTVLTPLNPTGVTSAGSNALIVTVNGTVLDSLDIFGFVDIRASNVTIRKCKIRGVGNGGTTTAGSKGLVTLYNAPVGANTLIDYCTLAPDTPGFNWDGVVGHDYTLDHSEVYNCTDGCGVFNTGQGTAGGPVNVTIQRSYFHDQGFFIGDPAHTSDAFHGQTQTGVAGGWTHNDVICQIQGGSNISIVGNTGLAFSSRTVGDVAVLIDNLPAHYAGTGYLPQAGRHTNYAWGSAVIITPNVCPVTNVLIDKNWLDGGETTVKVAATPYAASGITITNNIFGHNQATSGPRNPMLLASAGTYLGDVFTNKFTDGTALAVDVTTGHTAPQVGITYF